MKLRSSGAQELKYLKCREVRSSGAQESPGAKMSKMYEAQELKYLKCMELRSLGAETDKQ